MQASKLLLVSPDRDRLQSLRILLEPLGKEAFLASSGSAAVDLCRSHKFSVVLMDLECMDREGFEAAERIHVEEDARQTPILFLTPGGEPQAPGGYPHLGPADFSPAEPEALKRRIDEYTEASASPGLTHISELEHRLYEMSNSNEQLQQFAWAASHDLKEPLRNVLTYSERLMRSSEAKLDMNERATLSLIRENISQAWSLIAALENYTFVGGSRDLHLTPVDCATVVRACISQLELAILESNATVWCGWLPVLRSNESLLRQVFQNLIVNAVKYRSNVPPRVEISCERGGDQWVFSVRDNGVGVDAKYREYIFQPFTRLQDRRTSGSGIGLAICRTAIRRLGGSIWMEPGQGSGSIFRFCLPADGTLTK